ncbi:MAG: hypothetical protein GY869_12505, partial [Planctomycetes bacterium]|nr:hypothetical protein [Planctomycetota bacterium]
MPITNAFGDPKTMMVPIAQFDLDNEISGTDPNSNFYLGNNTGLRHTFVDTTVLNGVEYWYSLTAYDRGDMETGVQALESSRGVTVAEPNVASAIATAPFSDYDPPAIIGGDSLTANGGRCDSRLAIEIMDHSQLAGAKYRVTFNDVGLALSIDDEGQADSLVATTFNLENLDSGEMLLTNQPLLDETGDNVPVTDGFRVLAREA